MLLEVFLIIRANSVCTFICSSVRATSGCTRFLLLRFAVLLTLSGAIRVRTAGGLSLVVRYDVPPSFLVLEFALQSVRTGSCLLPVQTWDFRSVRWGLGA